MDLNFWIARWAVAMSAIVFILLIIYVIWGMRRHRRYMARITHVENILNDVAFYLEPKNKTVVIVTGKDGHQFVLKYLNAEASPILREVDVHNRVPYTKEAAIEAGMPQRLR